LSGRPGHMPHSCGQVPTTHQLSTGHTLQMICWKAAANHLVMGNQYFWWASKIWDPACPGTTTPLLDFRNPDEAAYICRHNFHAINVQGVCDCCPIAWLPNDIGNDRHLLADSAYPLRPWVLMPVPHPEDDAQRHYNIHTTFCHLSPKNLHEIQVTSREIIRPCI
jgi:hypothetical protein